MTDSTADYPFELTQTQAPTGVAGESGTRTGTYEPSSAGFRSSADIPKIEVGQQLDDFDLLLELGTGAFARVFLARQRSMQRLVAVKISANQGHEPQTLAQLDHDYIVRVFDQRILRAQNWRLLYMQYLPGGTLLDLVETVHRDNKPPESGRALLRAVDEALEARGEVRPTESSTRTELAALPWPDTVAWLGKRLAEALDYANSHGVLHRDIKLGNVLLAADGTPKLADFNISFARNVTGASPFEYFGGSLSYMSPEQLAACQPGHTLDMASLDARSDIYSLAVVLWELLTGGKPFDDSAAQAARVKAAGAIGDITAIELMLTTRAQGVSPTALAAVPRNCPSALLRVLLKALSADRDQRWDSGAELAEQLQLCLDPRARDLLDPPARSWRMRLRPFFLPIAFLAIMIPNLLASAYNIQHNQLLIVSQLSEYAQGRFMLVTAVANVVSFPLGAAVLLYWYRYIILVPRRLRRGPAPPAETLARTRRDCLVAGDRAVFIVFGLWLLLGLAFPLTMQLAADGISGRSAIHFFGSITICGAIATAYPFFLLTFYVVRSVYPELVAYGQTNPEEAEQLRALSRRLPRYLAVAASVPLLGVVAVTFLTPAEIAQVIVPIRALCIGGIAGFVLVYWLSRQIESDIEALERVIHNRVQH
ncbi:serine/threonine protein kinase [Mycolicibacterium novocastrense]|uniref:Serine/threonine protein kinase n=1 Tax=Mycolicibacterium novocastrense TaxID=59813 RepID=A0AAW5SMK8_MYCNV|nr:serine/threonine-protein kinase [Mycolicibacterium novocastrense]MCV7024681.1 serine/threonine protein kinase [Mycolicibacterium novocastrense]GAT11316.1 serine/threonine protein kinase [Mycolicibacterium novocastrense]